MKFSICLIIILSGSVAYSQPNMTAKEGFYYLFKVSLEKATDNAVNNYDNQSLNLRWFDLYVNLFDKANYDNYSKDEFKWPDYSRKILAEIKQGVESSDFNKLFSYRSTVSLDKYNFELGGFPITRTGSDITIFSDDHINYEISLRIGYWANGKDFDLFLKMDTKTAEKLIESIGQDRNVDVKIVYNLVNRNMIDLNKWDEKYLGIYVHKIIFLNGNAVFGEIYPKNKISSLSNIEIEKKDEKPKDIIIEKPNTTSHDTHTIKTDDDNANQQEKTELLGNDDTVYNIVEQMPEFPGGEEGLRDFLSKMVKYPAESTKMGIEGKVYVSFVVMKNGTITESRIVRGVDPLLDAEALRVVKSFPKWIPGKQNGKVVKVSFAVPVNFKLK